MRLAAVLLVAFACSGAFASEPKQPATPESPTPPAAAQPKAAAEVRQADNSDLSVKEWRSPITFDLDAGWLKTLPPGVTTKIEDLPRFYCDGVTLDRMDVQKRVEAPSGAVDVKTGLRSTAPPARSVFVRIKFHLHARRNMDGDKVAALEFTLLNDEQRILLGRRDELELAEGDSESWTVQYEIPTETIAAYTADGSRPRLRISMVVRND